MSEASSRHEQGLTLKDIEILGALTRHPALLRRILNRASGVIGELWVAQRIEALGYEVEIHENNLSQHDLTVRKDGQIVAEVEVKPGREKRPTWLVRTIPQLSQRHRKIWVFIAAPRAIGLLPDSQDPRIEMFVLYASEVRDIWIKSKWNQNNPLAGDVRRHQIDDSHLNAWEKLQAETIPGNGA